MNRFLVAAAFVGATSVAVPAFATNDTPPPCRTNCGTTPGNTDIRNTIGIDNRDTTNIGVHNNNSLYSLTSSGSSSSSTSGSSLRVGNVGSTSGVTLGNVGSTSGVTLGNVGSRSSADNNLSFGTGTLSPTATTGPVSQIVNFAAPKTYRPVVNPAIAPTMLGGGTSGVVVGTDANNPYASCFRKVTGQATYTGAVTLPFVSLALGRDPEMEDNAECIARINNILETNRLLATGRTGQAAVVRRDLEKNKGLRDAVIANREYNGCLGDRVDNLLTGECLVEEQATTETAIEFNKGAQGKPPAETTKKELEPCPPGQKRNPITLECQRG